MNFSDYQKETKKTAIYPDAGHNLYYPAIGLGGETGEVLEKIKKLWRDRRGSLDRESMIDIAKELGDVLWYVSQIATELGVDLDYIAEENIKKLQKRMDKGTLSGSGDNR